MLSSLWHLWSAYGAHGTVRTSIQLSSMTCIAIDLNRICFKTELRLVGNNTNSQVWREQYA